MKLQPMKTAPRVGQVLLVQELRPGRISFHIGVWEEYGYWIVSDFGPDFQDEDFIGWIPLPEIEV